MTIFLAAVRLLSATAQDTPGSALVPGEPAIIRLESSAPVVLYYEASGAEAITITARSLEADGQIDTVMKLAGPDGERLAYNDDHYGGHSELALTDSAIDDFSIPHSGIYTIWVSSYGGVGRGPVEVLLEVVDVFRSRLEQIDTGLTISARLPRRARYAYSFEAAAGEALTITVRDTSFTLDPRLTLVDGRGAVIAENDDHESLDLSLDALDARIADFVVTQDGQYTALVVDFLGAEGTFELTITRRSP